jgi:hypothetical protein
MIQEVSQASLKALCYLSVSITPPNVIRTALDMSWKVMQSTSWKARVSSLEFVQVHWFFITFKLLIVGLQ